jgi:hypothetical protein
MLADGCQTGGVTFGVFAGQTRCEAVEAMVLPPPQYTRSEATQGNELICVCMDVINNPLS